MNFFAIVNIFIAVMCLTLAIVILKYAQNSAHRIWAFFNLVLTVWSFSFFLVGISVNKEQASYYWRFVFIASFFIPVVFYHFVIAFCKLNRKILLVLCYAYAIFLSLLSLLTNEIFCRVIFIFNSLYYAQASSVFSILFAFWGGNIVLAFVEFFIYVKRTSGLQRIQSRFMFWSMVIGFAGGCSTILPGYGVKIYPVYQVSIIFYVLFTSYAIFKHGLIPLDIVIKRSIFYSTLATTVTILYFIGILIFQRIFNTIILFNNVAGSFVSLIVIAIIFIPLKNRIQAIVDKIILKNSPIEIAAQNENLRNEVIKTEKFKSIADLASMLAHEIKNPMTTLATLTEQLIERKDEPGFIEQYQELVTKEIERITSLLHELLVFAKPSQPKIADINPNEIIVQIIHLIQSKCEHSKIDIKHFINTISNILGDFNLLKQAFLNIVLNAIDAMPQGGTLTISTGTRESPT